MPITLWFWLIFLVLGGTLFGCTSYGPALVGSELPFVSVVSPDTVKKSATEVYATAGWPQIYAFDDRNFLASAGAHRIQTLSMDVSKNIGWSFAYGGMAYAGRYSLDSTRFVDRDSYGYVGGVVYALARMHISSKERTEGFIEPALSVYYEGGDYLDFRRQYAVDSTALALPSTNALSATLHFSYGARYRVNEYWVLFATQTNSIPLHSALLQYGFSGTITVARGRLSVWSRPAVYINLTSLAAFTHWTFAHGISYQLARSR